MVSPGGIEPPTISLKGCCSAAELRAHELKSHNIIPYKAKNSIFYGLFVMKLQASLPQFPPHWLTVMGGLGAFSRAAQRT